MNARKIFISHKAFAGEQHVQALSLPDSVLLPGDEVRQLDQCAPTDPCACHQAGGFCQQVTWIRCTIRLRSDSRSQ
jgi:hypothetical protein